MYRCCLLSILHPLLTLRAAYLPAPAGFVIPREEPLLCAIDLPGYSASDPFGFTPLDDSDYDAGGWVSVGWWWQADCGAFACMRPSPWLNALLSHECSQAAWR